LDGGTYPEPLQQCISDWSQDHWLSVSGTQLIQIY